MRRGYGRWRAVRRPWDVPSRDSQGATCAWWSTEPPILLSGHWIDEEYRTIHSLQPVFETLARRRAYFLYQWFWHVPDDDKVQLVAQMEAAHRRRHREHRFIHLCNTREHEAAFRRHGLEAVFCNHNAFIDERVYRPMPEVPRRFDAIYNARLKAYKRHSLAHGIDALALVYAYGAGIDSPEEVAAIRRGLPRAHWFNHEGDGSYRPLPDDDVARALNQARVGLCLSAVEGAMYASIEYLLCGLPVVSTASLGGRDVFFDEHNCIIVEATPEGVRRGVEEMLHRRPRPEAIRAAAIARLEEHRAVFRQTVQAIYDREGITRDVASEWAQTFRNRMVRYQSHAEIVDQLPR